MVIEYETSKYVREKKQLEILDTKNVFLRGKNPYDGLDTFFGVWVNKNTLTIVTIISWHTITYDCYLTTSVSTENAIREYLEHNGKVEIITRAEFKQQIQHIRSIIEI